MDLLTIIRAIWRHRLAVTPVILLTALAALYVLVVKPPVYEASSSLLLVNPPDAPTAAQIVADPKLAKINTNNPYYNLGDVWTADALISVVASDSAQAQVALSNAVDVPPIIQITGSASSPQAAIKVVDMVTSVAVADLHQMQTRQGVNDLYTIKTVELVQPRQAKLSVGGKLRSLIAVLGLGAILLFVTISAAQAMEKRRMDGSISPGMPARARLREAARANGDALGTLGSTAYEFRVRGDEATVATPGTVTQSSERPTRGDHAELRARGRVLP